MAGRQEKYLAEKKKEQQRELGARGTVAAVKSYMSSDGTGPYGVRSVSCFRGAHWRPCVCACVQLWSPSSLSHGFLSLTSPFYPACRGGNKVNKHGRVGGPPSFTPKTKQCPIKHPFISEQRRGAWVADTELSDIRGATCHFGLQNQTSIDKTSED